MIIILRLTSGEEIIGEIENDLLTKNEYYNILNPMLIVSSKEDYGGAMKLRDYFLLSDEELLSLPAKQVVVEYTPTYTMQEYYKKASYYQRTYTKIIVDEQIRVATTELDSMISLENTQAKSLTDVLMKTTKSRLQ
jgi:hypothetical protein